jgi:hypothetical protein
MLLLKELEAGMISDRSPDRVPTGSGSSIGTGSDRPLHAGQIRQPWEAGECVALGLVEGLGWFVRGVPAFRKKQIPRSARNDNLRAFRRAVMRVVGLGVMAGRAGAGVAVGLELEVWVIGTSRARGRAGSGSRSCR